jgi:hypothetical protein
MDTSLNADVLAIQNVEFADSGQTYVHPPRVEVDLKP